MKNVKWIFVVLFIFSLISFSFVEKDHHAEGLNVGDKAPNFMFTAADSTTKSLESVRGGYVLISFWASYDAASRFSNVGCSNEVKKLGSRVTMVSVSFDEYQSVFDETVKMDRIETANRCVVLEGQNSDVFRTYRLEKGFRNFLLDADGVIVAKDIRPAELLAYVE